MSRKITTFSSLNIKSTFEELAKIFDIKEADLTHAEFDIKPLFRGLSKDDFLKSYFYKPGSRGKYSKVCSSK